MGTELSKSYLFLVANHSFDFIDGIDIQHKPTLRGFYL